MTRQEMIKRLKELPDKLIESEKIYTLDIVRRIVQLQYDSFLKDLYKKERKASDLANSQFIYFRVNSWKIIMETEED